MMQLRWEKTPLQIGKDYIADVPYKGGGRYRVKRRGRFAKFDVFHNGKLVATEPTLDDAKRRAEIGADLLVQKLSS